MAASHDRLVVEYYGQMQPLKEACASLTVLKGATPQRLKEVLQALAEHKLRSEIATGPLTSQL